MYGMEAHEKYIFALRTMGQCYFCFQLLLCKVLLKYLQRIYMIANNKDIVNLYKQCEENKQMDIKEYPKDGRRTSEFVTGIYILKPKYVENKMGVMEKAQINPFEEFCATCGFWRKSTHLFRIILGMINMTSDFWTKFNNTVIPKQLLELELKVVEKVVCPLMNN